MAGNRTGTTPDVPGGAERAPGASAATRVSVAAVAGVCAGVLVALPGSWHIGVGGEHR
jgi:hypothetical protein